MGVLQTFLLIIQVIVAITLIGFILIQHGKGASAGVAFGSGASATMFGSQGASSFLTKSTAVLAFLFLSNSLLLGYLATQQVAEPESLMRGGVVTEEIQMETVPENLSELPEKDTSDVPTLDLSDLPPPGETSVEEATAETPPDILDNTDNPK